MNEYKLTWRERLADWISGGAISDVKRCAVITAGQRNHYSRALLSIYRVTEDGKSGTAKKVARMAEEALK